MRAAAVHPDPVRAAKLAIAAGADGITAHLREDRRHISDDDIARLKAEIAKPLNLEMAATDEMVAIALRTQPHAACLVPERRAERTTEGGLDVAGGRTQLAPVIAELRAAGIRVSLFIAADPAQIETAAALGAPVIEIHTGAWCHALVDGDGTRADAEWRAHPRGRAARPTPRARSPCRPRPRLRQRRDDRGAAGDRRTEHRSFPGRRGGVRRARSRRSRRCARAMDRGRAHAGRRTIVMILGIGSDITDVRRIAKVIERHGDRFLDRIFTATERARAERRKNRVETYAKRFAAKEACAKALGTGIRAGVWWRDMGVVNLPGGQPTMQLTGGALRAAPGAHAAGPRGADRSHDLRRRAAWRWPT